MNLQPTPTAPGHMKTVPLPSQETDGMETWKKHHISQQVCKAEFEKPLQKPAHSDLCNWCLSQRRAKPPGNSTDQVPWTKRTGQKFTTAGTCRVVDVGSKGARVKIRRNSCWCICPSQRPWNRLPLHHIKAQAGFWAKVILTINSKVFGAKQKGAH